MSPGDRSGSALAASLLWLAAGCSSSSTIRPADGGAATTAESGATDAGPEASTDGGTDAAVGDGSTGSTIVLVQNVTSAGTIGDVSIQLDPHASSGVSCVSTTSGPCVLDDCSAADAVDGGTVVTANAGVVTISGGNLASPLKVTYGAGGQYRPPLIGTALFDAGGVFTVSAPGADFPAFSGQSAPAPSLVTITAPALTAGTYGPTYLFDPAAALPWSWTGGAAGDSVVVTVVSAGVIITCSFDAAGGTGTIPAGVVARFPAMVSNVNIDSVSSATVAAGTDRVSLSLESSGPTTYLAPQ
jgi:hypothetical protein